jgi:hypothetical protein
MLKIASFPLGADFYDIISLLDKIQRPYKNHLLTSDQVKKALHLYDNYKDKASMVWVITLGCYSVKGFPYRSKGSILQLNPFGGTVSRNIAPEAPFGHGPRYKITFTGDITPMIPPPGYLLHAYDIAHWELHSTENT